MNTEILKINQTEVVCPYQNEQYYVSVKRVCEVLNIAHSSQLKRIKRDSILSKVLTLLIITGADGKKHKMSCIPAKFVFGWLFSISEEKVKESAKSTLTEYRLKCYETFYNHFYLRAALREKKARLILEKEIEILRLDLKEKDFTIKLKELELELKTIQSTPVEQL